jgi:hypothetical protein
MLCTLLRRYYKAQDKAALAVARVARRYCNQCKSWTVRSSCPTESCNQRELDPQHAYLKAARLLILDGEEGGFTPMLVWTCGGPASELSTEVNGGGQPLCKSIYLKSRCDRESCTEPHDRCPLHCCRAPHPLSYPLQLSKVYFYNEDSGPMLQVPQVVPPTTQIQTSRNSVIDKAAVAALEKLPDQPLWVELTISLLAEDFEGWIGLVQTAGQVDWDQLWNALEESPDRPADPAELQAAFEKSIKLTLCKTFKSNFEREGLDWSFVEEYGPSRSDGKEE